MKTNLKTVCALTILAMAGGSVFAGGPIGIGDFSGSEQVITFDPGFSQQCAPYEYEGVIFDEDGGGTGGACFNAYNDWGNFFSNISGSSQGIGFHDQWGNSKIIMNPPAGTTRFGCLLSTGLQTDYAMHLYDGNGNLLGSTSGSMPADAQAVFLGYEADSPIARVEITEPNGENGQILLMDDVRFEGTSDCLNLAVSQLVGGEVANWDVSGATPGAQVALAYGFLEGSTVINGLANYCADFGIKDIGLGRIICLKRADGAGNTNCSKRIPKNARGVRILSQAAEQGTCPESCMSNIDDQVII